MSLIRHFLAAATLFWAAASPAQTAAPFCLVSDSGQQSCFYYSLQACRQAATSLGGMCAANGQAAGTNQANASIPAQQFGPLDAMKAAQEGFDTGRRRGEEQREARLRAELLEAQIARERAAAAAATEQRNATGARYLYRCPVADGSVVYTGQPAAGCTVVSAYQPPQAYNVQSPAPPPQVRYFHGYPCTQDCSGHEAGYEWAEEEGIEDEDDCTGWSQSFIEGCQAYVEENH